MNTQLSTALVKSDRTHVASSLAFKRVGLILLSVLIMTLLLIAPQWVQAGSNVASPAAQWIVNTAIDEIDGECASDCSLRDAIYLAANGDDITFSDSYTIYLNSELGVNKTVTIDGSGYTVTVSGDSGGDGSRNVRVFYIGSSGVVTLTHLDIVSGTTADWGGGIYNNGRLTVISSTLSDNRANADGGGIYNANQLAVQNSAFSGNYAAQGGGGIYNRQSNLTLTNVAFSGNYAGNFGGGMYNYYYSSPTLTDVTFSGNSATSGGGGMYNENHSSPTLTDVTFSNNSTNSSGGGMHNNDNSSPTLTNVDFISNSSQGHGGGMYNNNGSSPTLMDVTFSGNSAYSGGGMYNENQSSPTLTNVTFSGNWVSNPSGSGGGMSSVVNSNPTLTNVTFSGNRSTNEGGGMLNYRNRVTLTNVTFSGNSAPYGSPRPVGGGMYNEYSDLELIDVTFIGNSAYVWGGGMNSRSSNLTLTNVIFISNTATGVGACGGGMRNETSDVALTNVTFSGNSAYYGGGMYNIYSNPALTNVTFSGNRAGGSGGGIYNSNYSSPQVQNSIFWGDTGGEIYNGVSTSTPVISDSVVQGGCPSGATCTNVITTTPQLGALGDYGGSTPTLPLLVGSSAIDAGNDAACPATDQRGVARPQGAHCDIGAFEAIPLSVTKSVTPALNAPYHGVVTYTVVLANISALSDTATIFTDTLPAGVDFGRWLENPGAVAVNDVITWTGALTGSAAITFTFTATHTGGYGDVITNTVHVSGTWQVLDAEAAFQVNPAYTITPTAGTNGSITPSVPQTVEHGDSITFTIAPDTGYHIADVWADGSPVGAVASYAFENVTADHALSATFAINTYTITPTAGVGGSITPAIPQTVAYSGEVAFTIAPNYGYHILDVGVDGVSVGAVSVYTFTNVMADHTISATFDLNDYALTTDVIGQGQITRTPDQATYLFGSSVTLTAVPQPGWYFGQWLGDASGTLTQTTVLMDANKVVTATFFNTPTYYTLTMGLIGNGLITPTVGAHTYLSGTVVPLSASPTEGWRFIGWSGNVDCTDGSVTLNADKLCTAIFARYQVYLPLVLK